MPNQAEKLAKQLGGALKSGLTVRSVRAIGALLGLSVVHAKAASDLEADLAPTAIGIVAEAAAALDETANGATASLFGLAQGSRNLTLTARRAEAASLLNVSADHFRKHVEADRVVELAEEILALNSVFEARMRHTLARPEAVNSRLNVDWLARHEAYRRIWTPVSALRGDLLVLLKYLRNEAGHFETVDRLMNILWRRAQFTRAIDRFIEDFGGLWLLSDPNKESLVAAAIRQIDVLAPGGENDDSWLRIQLAQAAENELDSFGDLIWRSEQGKEMTQLWLEWASRCRCALDNDESPRPTCDVHAWLGACDQFITLIDEDFDLVADWYRETRSPEYLETVLKTEFSSEGARQPDG